MKTLTPISRSPDAAHAATGASRGAEPNAADPEIVARSFQALSDATRIEILQKLAHGELCVCDLQSELGAAQSRLSFHLRKLKDAGLVTDRREGRWSYYALVPDALAELAGVLGEVESGARSPDSHRAACGCSACGD
jgi:ArsR family transcriptional regulator, arsenate/arsenite/antimonite-responsive transcriptional repressor